MPERIKLAAKSPKAKGTGPQPRQLRRKAGEQPRRTANKLNTMQRRFVDNYIRTNVIGQSAIDAGYSSGVAGTQLLNSPKIMAEVERKQRLMQQRADQIFSIEATQVLKELALVAFSNMGEYFKDWGQRQRTVLIPSRRPGQEPQSITIDEHFVVPRSKAELTELQQRCIAEITHDKDAKGTKFKFRTHDKLKALQLLGSYFGLFDGAGKQFDPGNVVQDLRQAATAAEQMFPGEEAMGAVAEPAEEGVDDSTA